MAAYRRGEPGDGVEAKSALVPMSAGPRALWWAAAQTGGLCSCVSGESDAGREGVTPAFESVTDGEAKPHLLPGHAGEADLTFVNTKLDDHA